MEVQEILYGRPRRLWMALTKAGPGGWIGYRVLPGLSGECGVSSVSCGSGFTAVIDIGVRVPIIGPIVCWLLRRAVGARVDAIGHHPKGRQIDGLLGRVGSRSAGIARRWADFGGGEVR